MTTVPPKTFGNTSRVYDLTASRVRSTTLFTTQAFVGVGVAQHWTTQTHVQYGIVSPDAMLPGQFALGWNETGDEIVVYAKDPTGALMRGSVTLAPV